MPLTDTSAAYVGILTPGSTSRMRAEVLRTLTPGWTWTWVDTDPPLLSTSRFWQSLAYRFQIGKGVDRINEAVAAQTRNAKLDVAWVDKAVFLRGDTMRGLRDRSRRLVHFTPDTAFGANSSRWFDASLGSFDLVVTTKSFEMDEYRNRIPVERIHLTTQGFDPDVHRPRGDDSERRREVAFVGLWEPDRARMVEQLLRAGVPVRLAGRGWKRFLRRFGESPLLAFEGEDVFGDAYAVLLSRAWIGLGALSKRFPELHTTRTFEIPACGAILATERTAETARFFAEDEVLFFENAFGLVDRIKSALSLDEASLARIAHAGRARVIADRRDYPAILGDVLSRVQLGSH